MSERRGSGFMVGFSMHLRRMGRAYIGFRISRRTALCLGVFISLWYILYYTFIGLGWCIYGICMLYYWMFKGIYQLCRWLYWKTRNLARNAGSAV